MLNPTASIYRKVKSSYKNNNVSDFYDSWLFDVEFYGRWAGLSGSPFYHSGRGLLTECEKFLTLFDYHSERMWGIFVFRGVVIPNEQSIVLSNAVESSYISSLGRRFFTPRCSVQNDMSFRARPVGRRGILSFLTRNGGDCTLACQEILHYTIVPSKMTVMSFRVKPVGWRGIPNYYCRRFFGA